MSGTETFWSRRRAGVEAEARAEVEAQEARAVAEAQATLEEKPDAEILEELNLPDPDALVMGDDFSAFMSSAVPDRLRRRALRVLWRSNPVLANVDMLVDYGEDFTDSATVVENMQTAYQVGKGMLKHVEEMARQAEARENPEPVVEAEEPAPEQPDEELLAEVEAADVVVDAVEAGDELAAAELDQHDPTPEAQPAPRRMKFRIEDAA